MQQKTIFSTPTVVEYRSTDVEGVGNYRVVGGNVYKWVLNGTGVAMVAGRAYFYGTSDLLFQTIYTLGQSAKGTGINLMAGLAVSAVPIGYWGWIIVHGNYASAGVEGTTDVAATDNLKGVSGQTYLVQDVAAGTAPTNRRGCIAMAAQAANSVAATAVFVNCLN